MQQPGHHKNNSTADPSSPRTTPRLRLIAPSASAEEAAAIVAALQRFMRATARPGGTAEGPQQDAEGWLRAAMLEAVEREPEAGLGDPWINT
jgi:hypothetical protein